eukprot:1142672-Pelagomonas_calceolata.AAC.8
MLCFSIALRAVEGCQLMANSLAPKPALEVLGDVFNPPISAQRLALALAQCAPMHEPMEACYTRCTLGGNGVDLVILGEIKKVTK